MSDKTDFMELAPGETELRRVKGDCWGTPGRTGRQISGTFIFTDRRLLFQGGGLIASMRPAFSLPYGEVTRIENCTVYHFRNEAQGDRGVSPGENPAVSPDTARILLRLGGR